MGPDKQLPSVLFFPAEPEIFGQPIFIGIDRAGRPFNWRTGVPIEADIGSETDQTTERRRADRMGPDNEPPKELTIYGERVTRGKMTTLPVIKLDCSEIGPQFTDLICANKMSLSAAIKPKPSKKLRCTTRKRFIKLLMSYGWSRNQAAKIALTLERGGQTYQNLFFNMWLFEIIWDDKRLRSRRNEN